MITIKNLRDETPVHEWQVRVDRSSPLGNPFVMRGVLDRDAVCDRYAEWLNAHKNDPKIKAELDRLERLYHKHGKLELFCWCYPKRCHSSTIAQEIERRISDS